LYDLLEFCTIQGFSYLLLWKFPFPSYEFAQCRKQKDTILAQCRKQTAKKQRSMDDRPWSVGGYIPEGKVP